MTKNCSLSSTTHPLPLSGGSITMFLSFCRLFRAALSSLVMLILGGLADFRVLVTFARSSARLFTSENFRLNSTVTKAWNYLLYIMLSSDLKVNIGQPWEQTPPVHHRSSPDEDVCFSHRNIEVNISLSHCVERLFKPYLLFFYQHVWTFIWIYFVRFNLRLFWTWLRLRDVRIFQHIVTFLRHHLYYVIVLWINKLSMMSFLLESSIKRLIYESTLNHLHKAQVY